MPRPSPHALSKDTPLWPHESTSVSREAALEAQCARLHTALANLVAVLDTQKELVTLLWEGELAPYLAGKVEHEAAKVVLDDPEGREAVQALALLQEFRDAAYTLAKWVHATLYMRPRDEGQPVSLREVQACLEQITLLTAQEDALSDAQWQRAQEDA